MRSLHLKRHERRYVVVRNLSICYPNSAIFSSLVKVMGGCCPKFSMVDCRKVLLHGRNGIDCARDCLYEFREGDIRQFRSSK